MSRTIGIIGGMGPLATAKMFEKIILNTKADTDQDHPHTIIDSNTNIPDRTDYIVHGGVNPAVELIKSAKRLENAGADLLIMPCNTAHYFYDDIASEVSIPLISMIEETVESIKRDFKRTSIGILSTDGTISSDVYGKELRKNDINPVYPSKEGQEAVMELIYGIKKGVYDSNLVNFKKAIEEMRSQGIDTFILGCTELSVAADIYSLPHDLNFVDPMLAIARKSIIKAGCDIHK